MKADIYQRVTNQILDALARDVIPWVCPWKSIPGGEGGYLPTNAASGRAYRGINVAILLGAQHHHGYASSGWMTYNQAQEAGAQVRRGEHGQTVVLFKPRTITEVSDTGERKEKSIPIMTSFTVFNREQIDGFEAKTLPPTRWPTLTEVDATIAATGAIIRHGGDRALYSSSQDWIVMPPQAAFAEGSAYYATLTHELTHWTSARSRCNRNLGARFGDQAYAAEELIAEMGSAFLCATFGIEGKLQHPEYIGSWIKVLQNDKRAVVHAASKAQAAVDFILGAQAEKPQEIAA